MLTRQARSICHNGFKPDFIVGVCRGGWIPARVLSDLLGNPNLASSKAECYTDIGETTAEPNLSQSVSVDVRGKRLLVVDEVADSGKTLKLIVSHLKASGAGEVKTATLFYKSHSLFKPDFFERETSNWIVFPWDTKEAIKVIFERCKNNPAQIKAETARLASAGVSKLLIIQFLKQIQETKPC